MFFLVDCNQFFVSCEQVFNPKLRKKPVVVLSSNDGCVVARSKEAKAVGVPMGAPAFKLKELFLHNQVISLSSNFSLYSDMSTRVMQVLETFSDEMEIYSVDEAFLFIQTDNPLQEAKNIRKKVMQWTGIPVSIGIGPTKTLAKVACDLAKKEPSSTFVLNHPETIEDCLRNLPTEEIWGIGRKLSLSLKKINVFTVQQFLQLDPILIKKKFGVILYRTYLELQGTPCLSLHEVEEPNQSVLRSRSFASTLTELDDLKPALASHIASAAEKIRKQKTVASWMTVFVCTSKHTEKRFYNQGSCSLPNATNYTPYLLSKGMKILEEIYTAGYHYKKVGVILGGLIDEKMIAKDLFEPSPQDPKHERAMQVLDFLNRKKGKKTLFFGSEGLSQSWRSRKDHISPQYTTSWDDLLTVS